eukprot:3438844-Rhodomonas_salina.5
MPYPVQSAYGLAIPSSRLSTNLAYDATAIGLRACYGMPGTDLAYGATSNRSRSAANSRCSRYLPRASYAVPGTEYGLSARKRLVLAGTIGLRPP